MMIEIMDKQQIHLLIEKYNQGKASEAELKELDAWYKNTGYADSVYPDEEDAVKQRMLAKLHNEIAPVKKSRLWFVMRSTGTAAAAVLIVLLAGYFFNVKNLNQGNSSNDIEPGSNKAVLTLSNGKTISLSDAAQGRLSEESGVRISKTKDGQVTYEIVTTASGTKHTETALLNTVTTPRGGQYQVIMPDGTRVWLNAASSVKFPASFNGLPRRMVELTGEAYFEVAKDAAHPFIVESNNQQIEVLGTHFNISNYAEEGTVRTTLLEGSVKISVAGGQHSILKPGQQASLTGTKLQVGPANTEQAVAWKNALFVFDHDNLESIMNKVSRWYDVEVVYTDEDVKKEMFSGKVSRFNNVSEVLKKLTLTDAVKFKIEGRRILVMK